MSRLLEIAWREYLENVRTKAFLIAVFMTPVIMGLSVLIPSMLEGKRPETRAIAIADVTGALGADVARKLAAHTAPGAPPTGLYTAEVVDLGPGDEAARAARLETARQDLDERVKRGDLFAYLVLRSSALARAKGAAPSEYRTANLFDVKAMEDVRNDVSDVVNARVVERARVAADVAEVLTNRVPLEARSVIAQGRAESVAVTVMPFVFTLLLFLTIVSVSQALITSTLEEKGNRVVEVLLSSVSPFQLMAGKIFGTCAVGLTLMTIWSTGGFAALALNGLNLVDPAQLLLCVVYYLLGFVLIASLMVAVGSACNTLKEAQNLLSPIMFLLTLPMFFWVAVGREPNGTLATVMSMIPPFTPFLMMMRIASVPAPPTLQIVGSIVLLGLSAWAAMHFAARVFRVGSLLYGKPPSIREIFRWMRTKG